MQRAVDFRAVHAVHELAHVGAERLYIAALAFGVKGVENQRRFTGAGDAGDHGEFSVFEVDIDIF